MKFLSTIIGLLVLVSLTHDPGTTRKRILGITQSAKSISRTANASKLATKLHPAIPATPQPDPPKPAADVASVAPPPLPSMPTGSCSAYSDLFSQYNWSVSVAEAICQAESGGNPNAVSPTDDYGLMQINHGLEIYGSAIYDPAFNIKIAYTVKYLNSGWLPWTTYTTGAYLRFL